MDAALAQLAAARDDRRARRSPTQAMDSGQTRRRRADEGANKNDCRLVRLGTGNWESKPVKSIEPVHGAFPGLAARTALIPASLAATASASRSVAKTTSPGSPRAPRDGDVARRLPLDPDVVSKLPVEPVRQVAGPRVAEQEPLRANAPARVDADPYAFRPAPVEHRDEVRVE
ncbi:hypothetical protein THAOC_31505, partial [Thalassiosira oceanica]